MATVINIVRNLNDSFPTLTPVLSRHLLPADKPQRFYDYKIVAIKRVEDNRANHIWHL